MFFDAIRRRIFAKFALLALGLGVLITLVVLVVYARERAERQISLVSTEIATISNKIARPAARLLEVGEIREASGLLSVFASFPYAICADLTLAEGGPMAAWPPIGCGKMRAGLDIEMPQPMAGPEALMLVRVDPDVLAVERRVENYVVVGLVATGGLLLFLSSALGFGMFVLRPLRRLSRAIGEFEQTGDHRHVEVTGEDEISHVMGAYNAMVDQEVARRQEIQEAHGAIVDSVTYATRIQMGLLPTLAPMPPGLGDLAVLWKPRDIVAGDIYWSHVTDGRSLLAVLDCTGHGVPGALMSMLAMATLERIMTEDQDLSPAGILARLSDLTRGMLEQESAAQQQSDGMDGAIIAVDHKSGDVTFAGARTVLFMREAGEVSRVKGDRISLGYRDTPFQPALRDQLLPYQPGRLFALATDGLTDQLGGPRRLSFGPSRIAEILAGAGDAQAVCDGVWQAVEDWRGAGERLDDATVLAFAPEPVAR